MAEPEDLAGDTSSDEPRSKIQEEEDKTEESDAQGTI